MADYTITVFYDGSGPVNVSDPFLKVPYDPGVVKTIRWVPDPEGGFSLKQIVFMRPVGPGKQVGVPRPGPDGSIEVTDDNTNPTAQAERFKYLVLIEKDGITIPSPDPEILNEPEGGLPDDED